MVMRDLLVRGLIAGLLSAALSVGFAEVVGEPQIERAIAFEEQAHGDHGTAGIPGLPTVGSPGAQEPPVVSRSIQRTLGLAIAVGVIGLAFGGVFAIAFAVAFGRIGTLGPRGTALLLALAAFAAIYLVPSLKYPANPPAIGVAATIGLRTQIYFAMVLISVAATVGAAILWRALLDRLSSWDAALVAGAALVLVLVIAFVALPNIDEVPDAFPATLLWRFRIASIGTQFVLWSGIGLIFGALVARAGTVATPTAARA